MSPKFPTSTHLCKGNSKYRPLKAGNALSIATLLLGLLPQAWSAQDPGFLSPNPPFQASMQITDADEYADKWQKKMDKWEEKRTKKAKNPEKKHLKDEEKHRRKQEKADAEYDEQRRPELKKGSMGHENHYDGQKEFDPSLRDREARGRSAEVRQNLEKRLLHDLEK